jgi:hypothetical protein
VTRSSGRDNVDMPIRLASCPVRAVPAPEAALILASVVRDPLAVHLRVAGKYGDAVRMPIGRGRSSFLFSTADHAEHVFAVNQDKAREVVPSPR